MSETVVFSQLSRGLLEQKIHAREPGELDNQPATILHPDMVQPLRVKIDRTARSWRATATDARLPTIICVCSARATIR